MKSSSSTVIHCPRPAFTLWPNGRAPLPMKFSAESAREFQEWSSSRRKMSGGSFRLRGDRWRRELMHKTAFSWHGRLAHVHTGEAPVPQLRCWITQELTCPYSFGLRWCQSVDDSYSCAICSNRDSLNVGPNSCSPIGSGLAPEVNPHGMLMPGIDAMLQVTVKTSLMYIASGSAVFSPIVNAAVGEVGEAITSHFSKAWSKS